MRRIISTSIGILALLGTYPAFADNAVLVDQAVMVNRELDEFEGDFSTLVRASYLSSGGYAVTSKEYIDAVGLSFNMGATNSVAQATLRIPVAETFVLDGRVPMKIFAFADNGFIDLFDFSLGFSLPVADLNIAGQSELVLDVTGALNAILQSSDYAGFRIIPAWLPDEIPDKTFPAFKGVRFNSQAATLTFTPGGSPVPGQDSAVFDGFKMVAPGINVSEVGKVYAELQLTGINSDVFTLTVADIDPIVAPGSEDPLTGVALLNCDAFDPPTVPSGADNSGASFSFSSELLEIPNMSFNNENYNAVLRFVPGSNPAKFRLLSLEPSPQTAPLNTVSAIGGSTLIEPTQDFIPLCHGWVLIGDSSKNRLVERNVITGETGGTYMLNTQPDQLTLDDENNVVYFSTHPETERLYKLDLENGIITYNQILEDIDGADIDRRYSPIDMVLGEGGNLFILLHDRHKFEADPFANDASSGLWIGILDGNADPVVPSIPLADPIRVVYDDIHQRVFVTTESNLATLNFDAENNLFEFVAGTDIPVGSGCTDFAVSPDGKRLAYACPNGNNEEITPFAIHDLDPVDYYNPDGEWYLGASPVSATFSPEGDMLLATDGRKLFFFDVITHLLIEKYELGLLPSETVKSIRLSRDGDYLLVFIQNEFDAPSGKMYWMKMPNISGTPIP